jgi:flagellar biosynthetic protein FliR
VTISPDMSYGFFLILIRTSGLLVSAPLLSHKGIPKGTKIGFAVILALVLVPVQGSNLPVAPQSYGGLVDGVLRESLFGLALGLAMNLVFTGMQMASRIVGLQMGFGLGGVFDPITGADHGVLDQFYGLVITLVFFSINGHYVVIQTLAETLRAVPPGSFDPFSIPLAGIPELMAGLMITSLRIAMPVMGALFMADLGLGLVSRTVPQMNVMVVGAPIKIVVGMLVIGAALPASVHIMNGVIGNSLAGSSQQLLGVR